MARPVTYPLETALVELGERPVLGFAQECHTDADVAFSSIDLNGTLARIRARNADVKVLIEGDHGVFFVTRAKHAGEKREQLLQLYRLAFNWLNDGDE